MLLLRQRGPGVNVPAELTWPGKGTVVKGSFSQIEAGKQLIFISTMDSQGKKVTVNAYELKPGKTCEQYDPFTKSQ